MKKITVLIFVLFLMFLGNSFAQELTTLKIIPSSGVKDQGMSGTCWCFSVISLLESDMMKRGIENPDLSEMYIVRNIYFDKAKNYILRQGFTRFSEGAFGHDVFPATVKYGLVPESVYPNLSNGKINHAGFDGKLKAFLDSVIAKMPIAAGWEANYNKMLDEKFGKVPEKFTYEGKEYTPQEFAAEVVKFNEDNYIGLTSFTHHPFYKPFNVEVPDNYSGGLFYNFPIDELIDAAEWAVMNDYTVGWDADVSNSYFNQRDGWAMMPQENTGQFNATNPDAPEMEYTQQSRQELFENLTTQDDHLMHLVGLKQSPGGKKFFYVKNSWGPLGPFKGFINVSETYFGVNTITLVMPLDGLKPKLRAKINR